MYFLKVPSPSDAILTLNMNKKQYYEMMGLVNVIQIRNLKRHARQKKVKRKTCVIINKFLNRAF